MASEAEGDLMAGLPFKRREIVTFFTVPARSASAPFRSTPGPDPRVRGAQ